MRAELQSAYAQLRATAAERDVARAEASTATAHVSALQADLAATDRMEKVGLVCREPGVLLSAMYVLRDFRG